MGPEAHTLRVVLRSNGIAHVTPAASQLTFVRGMAPYLSHYTRAFASCCILYPLLHGPCGLPPRVVAESGAYRLTQHAPLTGGQQ